MIPNNISILLVYTGETIEMIESMETGALGDFNFEHLQKHVPELQDFTFRVDTYQFDPPMDSSDMDPDVWCRLIRIISDNYEWYIGFVILHGTDTMTCAISILSFMLEGLNKSVILTGSQLSIGVLRTDGKENLLVSIEIVTVRHPGGRPFVPEMCIFFENHLVRSNCTTKINTENFNIFHSLSYPVLTPTGVHARYNSVQIHTESTQGGLQPHYLLDTSIVILKLFPGIQESVVGTVLSVGGSEAMVLEIYGSGNAPRREWFPRRLYDICEQGIVIVNTTQCGTGAVEMERYETSYRPMQAGAVCGYDSTTESTVIRLMSLLRYDYSPAEVRKLINHPITGEIMIA